MWVNKGNEMGLLMKTVATDGRIGSLIGVTSQMISCTVVGQL